MVWSSLGRGFILLCSKETGFKMWDFQILGIKIPRPTPSNILQISSAWIKEGEKLLILPIGIYFDLRFPEINPQYDKSGCQCDEEILI